MTQLKYLCGVFTPSKGKGQEKELHPGTIIKPGE